jgi:hypothetical protein
MTLEAVVQCVHGSARRGEFIDGRFVLVTG